MSVPASKGPFGSCVAAGQGIISDVFYGERMGIVVELTARWRRQMPPETGLGSHPARHRWQSSIVRESVHAVEARLRQRREELVANHTVSASPILASSPLQTHIAKYGRSAWKASTNSIPSLSFLTSPTGISTQSQRHTWSF